MTVPAAIDFCHCAGRGCLFRYELLVLPGLLQREKRQEPENHEDNR